MFDKQVTVFWRDPLFIPCALQSGEYSVLYLGNLTLLVLIFYSVCFLSQMPSDPTTIPIWVRLCLNRLEDSLRRAVDYLDKWEVPTQETFP